MRGDDQHHPLDDGAVDAPSSAAGRPPARRRRRCRRASGPGTPAPLGTSSPPGESSTTGRGGFVGHAGCSTPPSSQMRWRGRDAGTLNARSARGLRDAAVAPAARALGGPMTFTEGPSVSRSRSSHAGSLIARTTSIEPFASRRHRFVGIALDHPAGLRGEAERDAGIVGPRSVHQVGGVAVDVGRMFASDRSAHPWRAATGLDRRGTVARRRRDDTTPRRTRRRTR